MPWVGAATISSHNPSAACPSGCPGSVGHSYAMLRQQANNIVRLTVAGLGLAGSVDAGRSVWGVSKKQLPRQGAFPPTCPRWMERPALTCPTSVA